MTLYHPINKISYLEHLIVSDFIFFPNIYYRYYFSECLAFRHCRSQQLFCDGFERAPPVPRKNLTAEKTKKNEEKIHLFFGGRRAHKNAQASFGKKLYLSCYPALLVKLPFRGPSAPPSVVIDFSSASANKRHRALAWILRLLFVQSCRT